MQEISNSNFASKIRTVRKTFQLSESAEDKMQKMMKKDGISERQASTYLSELIEYVFKNRIE